jgi:hypothetical protein
MHRRPKSTLFINEVILSSDTSRPGDADATELQSQSEALHALHVVVVSLWAAPLNQTLAKLTVLVEGRERLTKAHGEAVAADGPDYRFLNECKVATPLIDRRERIRILVLLPDRGQTGS